MAGIQKEGETRRKGNALQVPDCRYGAACTRRPGQGGGEGGAHSSLLLRDCVFKHPPKPAKSAIASVHGSV